MSSKRMGKKSAKHTRHLDRIKKQDDILFTGYPDDVVIPVMGPTGAGKSNFINQLLDTSQTNLKTEVGHDLQSCTSQLVPIVIPFGSGSCQLQNPFGKSFRRLVLVDTPGFDDTYTDDVEILRRIAVWLADSYNKNMKLGGVIYLHDITQPRMLGTGRRNLDMFQKLVGSQALKRVFLATTKWDLLDDKVAEGRQQELQELFWNDMIKEGSKVVKIDVNNRPPEIVQLILDQMTSEVDPQSLAIQNELINMEKYVPETEAGKTLKYTITEAMALQKQKANNEESLAILRKLAKGLSVPLSDRIKRFFS